MPIPGLLDLARRIVAIPSVTTEGTRALASWLAEEVLAGGDLSWRLDVGEDPEQVSLVATKALDAEAPILLNSHLDTVPPGDPSLWTRCGGDPFRASLRGDLLYGLGTADAKLDWLCKALALRRHAGRRFARGVIFLGTFGEESGLRGARRLVGRLPRHPVAAWIGEPTELRVVTRHKGLLVITVAAEAPAGRPEATRPSFRARVRGRAAHSSTPELGENAIVRALDLARRGGLDLVAVRGGDAPNKVPAECEIEWAGDDGGAPDDVDAEPTGRTLPPLPTALRQFALALLTEQRQILSLSTLRDPAFVPPTLTSNLSRLEAAGNRVEATLDFRCLPDEESAPLLCALERFAEEQRRRGLRVDVAVERDNPPLRTPADGSVVTASLATLAGLERPLELATKAGCTEAGVYAAAGIPSVVFGPGRSAGNIHAPNEHVPVAELEGAVEFYARLIGELCA